MTRHIAEGSMLTADRQNYQTFFSSLVSSDVVARNTVLVGIGQLFSQDEQTYLGAFFICERSPEDHERFWIMFNSTWEDVRVLTYLADLYTCLAPGFYRKHEYMNWANCITSTLGIQAEARLAA